MKAVIICDGELAPKYVIERDLVNSSLLIAADGGAYKAIESGFSPDVIIGDLDSYTPSGNEKAKIFRDQSQETNDLEKALNYAKGCSASEVVVFGATGKRLDHTLKNLSVLLQFHRQFHSLLYKDRYSLIRVILSPFKAEFPLHTSVSLFPLSGKVTEITTDGLKYPLNNGTLENGVLDGSSNETIKKTVEIEFKKGDLLLLVNYKTGRE
jgi:thiamine pyrophosphokinase